MKAEKIKKYFVLPVVLLLLLPNSNSEAYDASAWKARQSHMVLKTVSVQAAGKNFQVDIYTEPERQGWGRQLGDWVKVLLPAFLEKFGEPQGIKQIFIVEDSRLPSLGWNGQKDGIRLKYPAGPEVLAEHLAHYWIHPRTVASPWLQKGLARWEGLMAMKRAGFGLQAMDQWRRTLDIALSGSKQFDRPLDQVDLYDSTREQFDFIVAKSTVFSGLVYTLAGERDFDKIVMNIGNNKSPVKLEKFASALKNNGQQLESIFSGWVRTGAYGEFTWADLEDNDRDAIPDGFEPILGTDSSMADTDNDTLSDGYEFWHNLSPVDRDSNGDGRFDRSKNEIAIDGLAKEWDQLNDVSGFDDATGDGQEFDIRNVSVHQDDLSLIIKIEPEETVSQSAEFWVSLQFDFDGDKKPELLVITDHADRTWFARLRVGQKPPNNGNAMYGLISRRGEVLELNIPASLFEGHQAATMNVRVDRPGAVAVIDHTGAYWHKISLAGT